MATSGLTFVLDQNLSVYMVQLLRVAAVHPVGRVTSLAEMGFPGNTPDREWLASLGQIGGCCVVTRDGAILRAAVEREAWLQAKVSLLVLDKKWGLHPRHEIARRLLFWWPLMVAYAEAGKPGAAWTVSSQIPDGPAAGIRLVTGPGT